MDKKDLVVLHSLGVEEAFAALGSSAEGLSNSEAAKRLLKYGPNKLPEEPEPSAIFLFLGEFNSPLMYIMMFAVVVSAYLANTTEAVFIFVVMTSNALVGFYQEHKANKSMKALRSMIVEKARVVREGLEHEIEVASIVPGDIIVLRAGDKVSADGRILEERALRVNEASLTGESKAAEKSSEAVSDDAEVADRTNMVFMGTTVEEGFARVLVESTGAVTEYGDIVSLLKDTPEEATPLQKTVISLSKFIGVFITLVVGAIVLEGYLSGHDPRAIFETALALFVSAIPEGLLPGITIVLVLGMRRILKRNGLVRRLSATETLGGVTVICTDKTGTLTQGKMAVGAVLTADEVLSFEEESLPRLVSPTHDGIRLAMRIATLSSDAYIENPTAPADKLVVRGNLTEQALLRMTSRLGIDAHALADEEPIIDSLFFSSERKFSAFLRRTDDNVDTLYVLGAPEALMERLQSVHTAEGEKSLEAKASKELVAWKEQYIEEGYRIVAVAFKKIPKDRAEKDLDVLATKLVLAGFIALTDPVRADVPAAFEKTRAAGIRTVVITGDHKTTARIVAEKVGLSIAAEDILEGHQVEALSEDELREKVKTVALYARVSPRHKLRIVQALEKNGEVVAMFGDGVNDAPALKAADIGVAIDTNVSAAREVADIILLDGGFGTIVEAIEQGRIIFNNIRKVFLYLIVQDFSQFFIFMVTIFLGLPLPILAAQLLLVNLVESGLPDLALTTEEEREGLMDEPPRNPKESILNQESKYWMICVFIISGLTALGFYFGILQITEDIVKTRTMMTVFLCLESLFLVFSMRSFTRSIIRRDIFDNKILVAAVILSFAIVLLAVYLPAFQTPLKMVPLGFFEWGIIVLANLVEIALIDWSKLHIFKRRHALS